MQVKSIAECILPSLNYHVSISSLFCLFLSGRVKVFTLEQTRMPVRKLKVNMWVAGKCATTHTDILGSMQTPPHLLI